MAKKKEPRPVGRPTDYKPEYCEQLIEYFSEVPYKEIIKKIVTKDGEVVEVPAIEATDFKTLAGFAISIGVHSETLLNWSKEHPEFFDAYKRAKDFQQQFLAVNGNKGLINPAFSIFTAKNVLNWRDKKEIEVAEKPLEKMSDEDLENEIQKRLESK
jgi:hypothetical protein